MKTQVKCPVCGQKHDYLVHRFHDDLDQPLVDMMAADKPGWDKNMGACTRCIDQAHLELQLALLKGKGEPGEVNGYKILPTPLRLNANPAYDGSGVTICFIDSGFYPHPDLVYPKNRILAHFDVTKDFQPQPLSHPLTPPPAHLWHGTMTTVVAAGNGYLSHGQYRGVASGANLVLLQVMEPGVGITGERIVKALDWAVENRRKYNIRIINLSVTDDEVESFQISEVDQAVQRAVEKGIFVAVASGNDPDAPLKAPANSPHALTVGGLNDRNSLDPLLNTLYHSTFGETIDRFQKPDLIAPAIWLAAPILPGTKEQREATALFDLAASSDLALKAKLANLLASTRLDRALLFDKNETVREAIAQRISEAKYISPHYQHADGTSFAAPIVCSVAAQMLEASPRLDPATIREILLLTAKSLPGEPAQRQGWGLVQPAHAVEMAAGQPLSALPGIMPVVDFRRMVVDFYLQHSTAREVTLTGDFTDWSQKGLPMKSNGIAGQWVGSVPFHSSGTFRYKFLIDKKEWLTDPRNLFREADGFNGFNSKLIIG